MKRNASGPKTSSILKTIAFLDKDNTVLVWRRYKVIYIKSAKYCSNHLQLFFFEDASPSLLYNIIFLKNMVFAPKFELNSFLAMYIDENWFPHVKALYSKNRVHLIFISTVRFIMRHAVLLIQNMYSGISSKFVSIETFFSWALVSQSLAFIKGSLHFFQNFNIW